MPKKGIGRRMACWWYLIFVIIDLIQAQDSSDVGSFLTDPFLELTAGITAPINQKTNKTDSSCISNGTLIGSIIATLLLSCLIAFFTWLIYLREKLQELQSYENQWKKHLRTSAENHHTVPAVSKQGKKSSTDDDTSDHKGNQLPLDVTDYKYGTYPFRQSQIQSVNGHCNPADWLSRVPSSFRSVTTDQDTQMMDIELLNPTFCGLNFSITGSMRAGIFIKEILDKETAGGQMKLNSSDKLRTGDRIIALTVCFESIVYEDALTILSYASPYPVILRVQRPLNSTKINVETEKRPATVTKVKWRDDFEHYDNDTPYNRSVAQADSTKTLITELDSTPTTSHHRSSSKKSRTAKSASTGKGNKLKTISNTVESKTKHSDVGKKKISNQMIFPSTGLSSKPIDKISSNKPAKKSSTNKVTSYLHHRGTNGGKHVTDADNNPEAIVMPYYDSPYDYYDGQSHLNKNNNNNNSSSIESLSAVRSVYTLQLSLTNANLVPQRIILPRRCERRLSSPSIILPIKNEKDLTLENIDTYL